MKFPIYRPRGLDAPHVADDIKQIWQEQITMMHDKKAPNYLVDSAQRIKFNLSSK